MTVNFNPIVWSELTQSTDWSREEINLLFQIYFKRLVTKFHNVVTESDSEHIYARLNLSYEEFPFILNQRLCREILGLFEDYTDIAIFEHCYHLRSKNSSPICVVYIGFNVTQNVVDKLDYISRAPRKSASIDPESSIAP